MPRMDHQVSLEQLAYEARLVLILLVDEINILRQQAGLPVRTPQQVRQALRAYVAEHPRGAREGSP